MNKPNHPPAGVLGIGIEALLAPVAYVPGADRPAAANLHTGLVEAIRDSMPARLLASLRDRGDWSGPWYRRSVTALKYLARSICMPLQHDRFLSFLDANPLMRTYRQRDPRLLERHMHRYVNAHWGRRQRLQQLQQHYRFALTHLPSGLFELVYVLGHASLGSLTAKDGSLLTLCLRPPIFKGCEGELCLQLCDVNEDPLYSVVFSVSDETPAIVIGCLQGPRGEHAKELVRELTRNLHGMRPKQLMLSLVYAFARHYGIRRLLAISNEAHPLRRSGRPLYSDYDAFWTEQHGELTAEGWFALPPSQIHKSEAEVASHHRSAFRRREALRQQAERLLANALEQPVPPLPELLAQAGPDTGWTPRKRRAETSWVS
ncbi:VirK/YbjX family protein [Dyella acidiphila]|uniref:DUF535 family protein n=1 Tax=Dyella acidiphila TaxID=2775866 RepID=A0ABR9G598_9GAMM|nr:DUF535 family protein [Dyella acidiphila]MBE1159216.1 DUF535 family protein [Dyella acidiphila]